MTTWPILSVVTFLPVVGALLVYLSRGDDEAARRNSRWIALWTTLITFAVSLILIWRFDPAQPDFQFVEKASWLASGITYHMGVDGISLPFVILTTALMPFCIIASWKSITLRVREYMMAFLILETLMIGTFSALDLVLFYLFFEGGLIPMFLIIGVWGGPRRVYASFKFFLYTLLGSVLMLLAIMALYWNAGTTDIPALMHTAVPRSLQTWAWLAFFASFAVKMPMWPVHTWLPDAHVEAPTAGSVILASILLKMGGYGFLRFSLPMFPLASHDFAPLIFSLSVIAIIYTSLVALMQEDIKKLIAYSSVAHMGFVTMGIFAGTTQGVAGGEFQMISHGIVAGALFLCSGYEAGQNLGHLNLAFTAAVPLSLWACLRAASRHWSSWHLGVVLGLLFLFEFGVSQEIFASQMLFGAVLLLVLAWLHPAQRLTLARLLPGILRALALCLLLASPFIWAMLRSYHAEQANFSTPDVYANDLLAAFIPTPLVFFGGHLARPISKLFTGNSCEQGGYYGLPLMLLAVTIWRTTPLPAVRVLATMALLAAVAALGPYAHVLGYRISTAPWMLLYRLPFLAAMLPGRFSLYAWLALTLLLSLWLAQPGSTWRRYALAGLCIASVLPAQSTARNWRQPVLPPVFTTLPPGAHVLVLPVFAQEMGWQYATGMRFVLVGQGYIGNGRPAPFTTWPLYPALWENRFPDINPQAFSAYLQDYDVQDVVLLPHGYRFFGGKPVDEAAETRTAATLLQQAGWRIVTSTPEGAIYQPTAAITRWTPAQITAFMLQAHRAKLIRFENRRVCQIRRFARLTGLNPAPLLGFYVAHPPLPVETIVCPP